MAWTVMSTLSLPGLAGRVTLYELLTGSLPFLGNGPGATILAILSQPPRPLPEHLPQGHHRR